MVFRRVTVVLCLSMVLVLLCGSTVFLETSASPDLDYTAALWIAGPEAITKIAVSDGSVLLRIHRHDKVRALALDERNERLWALGRHALHGYGLDGSWHLAVPIREWGPDGALAVDPVDGGVWAAIGNTLYRFDTEGVPRVSLEPRRKIDAMVLDTVQSRLWVAINDTLTAYDRTGNVADSIYLGRHE